MKRTKRETAKPKIKIQTITRDRQRNVRGGDGHHHHVGPKLLEMQMQHNESLIRL